jgi:hypothetical protein
MSSIWRIALDLRDRQDGWAATAVASADRCACLRQRLGPRRREDRGHLVLAALRMVGFVPVASPEAPVDDTGRQAKDAAPQPISGAPID